MTSPIKSRIADAVMIVMAAYWMLDIGLHASAGAVLMLAYVIFFMAVKNDIK